MKIEKIKLEHEIFANCYLVIDEPSGEAAVIDPGFYAECLPAAFKEHEGIKVKYILLTHGHFDHIMGVYGLKEATGAEVCIHEKDAECLYNDERSLARGAMPMAQQPVHADVLLKDGDELRLGDDVIRVMHTPGHTPGSVCYLFVNDRVMFSGDTLFCRTVGRTDLLGGSAEDMQSSIRRIIALDGDYRVYPGHNRETTLDSERVSNHWIRRMNKN